MESKNANWNLFSDLLKEENDPINDINTQNIEKSVQKFTTLITSTAHKTIGIPTNSNKPRVHGGTKKLRSH